MVDYSDLLEEAYESIEPVKECSRFEILKVKGHHEGTRTVVTNFSQVADCLRRDQEHFFKFLTKELASSGEIRGDRLILSRKLSSKDINEKVERYANQFVLCKKCKKPDTELENDKGKSFLRCLACGEKYEVHKV